MLFFTCSVSEILLYPLAFSYRNRVFYRDAFLKHISQLITGPKHPWEKIVININNRSPPYSHCCSQQFTTCCRAYFFQETGSNRESREKQHTYHIDANELHAWDDKEESNELPTDSLVTKKITNALSPLSMDGLLLCQHVIYFSHMVTISPELLHRWKERREKMSPGPSSPAQTCNQRITSCLAVSFLSFRFSASGNFLEIWAEIRHRFS